MAEPALRKALAGRPSAEARRRLKALLRKLAGRPAASSARVRALCYLEVLEHAATPEARKVLKGLAQGPAPGYLGQEAKAALRRLA
jgi:hypothetical protein